MKLAVLGLIVVLALFFGCAQQQQAPVQQPAAPPGQVSGSTVGSELEGELEVEDETEGDALEELPVPPQDNATGGVPPAPPATPTITASQLATHNTQGDCWVVYGGKVYDVTSFLPKHPGSAAAIAPYCGTGSQFAAAFEGKHGTSKVAGLESQGVLKGNYAG